MDFAQETIFDVSDEIEPLLERHYQELCLNRDVVKLAPRWDAYNALEQAGLFKVFTARQVGALVGYSAFFIQPHMHYSSLVVAQNDVFWLEHECRMGSAALRFLRWTDRALTAMGVHKVIYHCKPSNNFAPILHRLGYADQEVMTGKLLTGA